MYLFDYIQRLDYNNNNNIQYTYLSKIIHKKTFLKLSNSDKI